MDPNTGKIYEGLTQPIREDIEKSLGYQLIPLTEKLAKEFKPLSKRMRKFLLRGNPCPCLSGKSFKKCCWKKYKKIAA